MKLIKNNFNLLLVTGIFIFACSFMLVDQTFDIRIFDTFYVINLRTLYWCLTALHLLAYLFYKYSPVPLFSKPLVATHIVLTVFSSLTIIIHHFWNGQNALINKSLELYNVEIFHKNNFVLTILLFVLGLVQATLFVNLAGAQLFRWRKQ